jgi:hypothetical protein
MVVKRNTNCADPRWRAKRDVRTSMPLFLGVRHNTAQEQNEKGHGSRTNRDTSLSIHNTPYCEETNSQTREGLSFNSLRLSPPGTVSCDRCL